MFRARGTHRISAVRPDDQVLLALLAGGLHRRDEIPVRLQDPVDVQQAVTEEKGAGFGAGPPRDDSVVQLQSRSHVVVHGEAEPVRRPPELTEVMGAVYRTAAGAVPG